MIMPASTTVEYAWLLMISKDGLQALVTYHAVVTAAFWSSAVEISCVTGTELGQGSMHCL
jgi:hypothetical protein